MVPILSTCSVVPYHYWNFFGLSMVSYMTKIFLRHEHSISTSLIASLQFFEMMESFHLSYDASYGEMDGSSPNATCYVVVNATENSPQSTLFFCCCTVLSASHKSIIILVIIIVIIMIIILIIIMIIILIKIITIILNWILNWVTEQFHVSQYKRHEMSYKQNISIISTCLN